MSWVCDPMGPAALAAVSTSRPPHRPNGTKANHALRKDVDDLHDPRQRCKALTANPAGFWRYRIGDGRVVVEIREEELVFVAIGLGHRSEIYRGG